MALYKVTEDGLRLFGLSIKKFFVAQALAIKWTNKNLFAEQCKMTDITEMFYCLIFGIFCMVELTKLPIHSSKESSIKSK